MSGNLTTPSEVAHLVNERGQVRCAFLRVHDRDRTIDHASIKPTTGHAAWRTRLREAARFYARQLDYGKWAVPGLVPKSGDWLVFEAGVDATQPPAMVKRLPTQAAAEMWMLHGAE